MTLILSLNYIIGGTNTWYYYHYNAQGDVVAVTDSSGAVYRQYVYDPYGNIISIKDGSGTPVDISNDSGFNNAYLYDTNGSLVSNHSTTSVYKPSDWTKYVKTFKPTVNGTVKIRLEVNNGSGLAKFDNIRLSPGNEQITMAYDSTSNYVNTTTDQLGHTVTINEFNPYGLAKSVTTPGDQNLASATTTASYDGLNQLRSVYR